MSKLIKLNKKNNHLVEIVINRIEKLNAMTKPMWIELGKVFNKLSENKDLRGIDRSADSSFLLWGDSTNRDLNDVDNVDALTDNLDGMASFDSMDSFDGFDAGFDGVGDGGGGCGGGGCGGGGCGGGG